MNYTDVIKMIKKYNLAVFTPSLLSKIMHWNKTKAYNTIKQLKKKELIWELKKGTYSTSNFSNEFKSITEAYAPSYVSLWTALSYYQITKQVPMKTQIASTKYQRIKENIDMHIISKDLFLGYINVGFPIATPEKAVFDLLWFNLITIETLKEMVSKNPFKKTRFKSFIRRIPSNKRKVSMVKKLKEVGIL